MQLAHNLTEVHLSPDLAPKSFQIGNSAKMFALLSDKLYSDKIKAVVREYACNALDAHSSIGQTKPFLISAPNRVSPMFSVRDFGPGLSHDDVMNLYTTFFESSKSGSNDEVGGFGLGSKSGFAYADAFTVVSIFENVRSVYACFRGGDGVPQVTVVETSPTEQPPGFEVKVPVAYSDFYSFGAKLSDVTSWFPKGSFTPFGFTPLERTNLLETPSWFIQDGGMPIVIMGPVAYPLDWSQADISDIPNCVGVRFNIGDLDLAPSREGLSYDPQTIARIKQRGVQIQSEIKNVCVAHLDKLQPLTRIQQHTNFIRVGMYPILGSVTGFVIPVKGESLSRIRGGASLRKETQVRTTITFSTPHHWSELNIYFNDLPVDMKQPRAIARMGTQRVKRNTYLIHPTPSIPDIAALRALIPDAPVGLITALSTLEPPPVQRTPGPVFSNFYRVGGYNSSFRLQPYQDISNRTGLYIPFSGSTSDQRGQKLANLCLHEDEIFGLTKKLLGQLDLTKFTPLEEHLKGKLDRYLADPDVMRAFDAHRIHNELDNTSAIIIRTLSRRTDPGIFGPLTAACISFHKDYTAPLMTEVVFLNKISTVLDVPRRVDHYNIQKQLEKFRAKNPLLVRLMTDHLSWTGSDDAHLKALSHK